MPIITLETSIACPVSVAFDLSRNIDLHVDSLEHTNEKAIAGRTSGLIELSESVTWRAKHFGVYQNFTSRITEMDPPSYFVDEMTKGAFKSFRHEHHFTQQGNVTLMKDVVTFTSPLGLLGKIANVLFLERYLINLLKTRNELIKKLAEKQTTCE